MPFASFFVGIPSRVIVFFLASLSFACLLGQFYGLWSMHWFGCWVLPPSTALLVLIAIATRDPPRDVRSPYTWIVQGAIGGSIAAVAYDLYRLYFVLNGAPLFKVFPLFGEFLWGGDQPRWWIYALGWAYHFSNGAALGIMFLSMVPRASGGLMFLGAVAWALAVETMLLMTPYPTYFGLPFDGRFIFLTASAHAIFGIALGIWCRYRVRA
ncbi:MAG: hypothetical protein ACJ8C4_06465 [Gemmataceae bacterium]